MTAAKPADVIAALAAVSAEMPAIGKDGRASQAQGGYSYRGIEAIASHASGLLAKYGVVFVPDVQHVETREITVNGKPWTDTILTVGYRICGPGGPSDYVEATVVGIGRDNADKGANKALTQAFKYVLLQVLCIADSKDDGDSASHEADALPEPDPVDRRLIEQVKARIEECPAIPDFVAWKDDQGFPWPWPVDACKAMLRELDRIEGAAAHAEQQSLVSVATGDTDEEPF